MYYEPTKQELEDMGFEAWYWANNWVIYHPKFRTWTVAGEKIYPKSLVDIESAIRLFTK